MEACARIIGMSETKVPWFEGEWLGFDTETTGVWVRRDRIATASLIRRVGGEDTAYNWVINPGVPMPVKASEVNGLTDEYLEKHGEQPAVALAEIASELAAAMSSGVPVVGFNVAFDFEILEAELARYELPTLRARLGGRIAPVIDPLVLDRTLDCYRRGKRKLATVCEAYGLDGNRAFHQADSDVTATLDLLGAMIERYESLRGMELDELHDFQAAAHRTWAENFNEYMARTRPDYRPVNLEWFFA